MQSQQRHNDDISLLLVDDSYANLIALEAILAQPGYHLVTASSGPEALRAMAREEFAVILLDVMMPGMDGFEVAQLAKSDPLNHATPIIFVTAVAREAFDRMKGYGLGAADYLLKPLNEEEVKAKVAVFAELHRSRRELRDLNHQLEAKAKEKAKELAESNERFRLFVEGVKDYGLVQMDADGRFITWNAGAERLLGYRVDEIIGLPFRAIFTDQDVAAGIPEQELDLARRYGRADDTRWHRRKDNSRFWAHGVTTVLLDEHGVLQGYAKILRDYTAAKAAEEAVRASEYQLKLITNSIPALVFYLDHEQRFRFANASSLEWLKRSPDDVVGQHLSALVGVDAYDKLCPYIEKARAGHEAHFELLLKLPGQKDRYVSGSYTPDHPLVSETSGVIGLLNDQTAQRSLEKQAQEQIELARELAEKANHAKSEFLANMSHEIRTPLNSIVGFTEFLLEKDLTEEDRHDFVVTISRNCSLLVQLIDDILDLSKVEAGKITLEQISCSLPSLLSDVEVLLSPLALEKGIYLYINARGIIPDSITTDPTRLKQILLNIISNALKFTSVGGVEVTVFWSQAPTSGGSSKLSFIVKDTGRGISQAQQASLFEPFSQADATTTRKYGGTGLGLVLARKLAQALGGDVVLAHSTLGQGSEFVITTDPGETWGSLAAAGKSLRSADGERAPQWEASDKLQGLRVLVAEDMPDNQRLIQRMLHLDGAEVVIAHNGEEAVTAALAGNYDAVLMDIQMPICDGYEAAAELRRRGYQQPIIALTAHALDGERAKALLAGCNDHLPKPIDRGQLVGAMMQVAKQKALLQPQLGCEL